MVKMKGFLQTTFAGEKVVMMDAQGVADFEAQLKALGIIIDVIETFLTNVPHALMSSSDPTGFIAYARDYYTVAYKPVACYKQSMGSGKFRYYLFAGNYTARAITVQG